jgi:hypothetical protein
LEHATASDAFATSPKSGSSSWQVSTTFLSGHAALEIMGACCGISSGGMKAMVVNEISFCDLFVAMWVVASSSGSSFSKDSH